MQEGFFINLPVSLFWIPDLHYRTFFMPPILTALISPLTFASPRWGEEG